MQRATMFAVTVIGVLTCGMATGQAAPATRASTAAAEELSAQARADRIRTRPRTQLRVYPRYPRRNVITLYPLPYEIDHPGPNAVRQCVSRLVEERRPGGTVIVPRTRCWWARG